MANLLALLWRAREHVVALLCVLLSLALLTLPPWRQTLIARRAARLLITPVHLALSTWHSYRILEAENIALRRQNADLGLQVHSLHEAREENARLRSLLDFRGRSDVAVLPARIISHGIGDALTSLVIDLGSVRGVAPSLPVLTTEGLVGKVVEVDDFTAIVQGYTDKSFRVSGLVLGRGEIGILQPGGGSRLLLTGLSSASHAAPGDEVVSSGLGGVYPRGIPVGRVIAVEDDELGLQRRALVDPAVRLNEVLEVFVLVDPRFLRPTPTALSQAGESLAHLWGKVIDHAVGASAASGPAE